MRLVRNLLVLSLGYLNFRVNLMTSVVYFVSLVKRIWKNYV